MLLCILGAALGAYYVFYVSQQTGYLITRNFRLLATLGEHIEAAIRSDQTVLSHMRYDTDYLPNVKAEASRFIPFIGSAWIVDWPEQKKRKADSDHRDPEVALQFMERNT